MMYYSDHFSVDNIAGLSTDLRVEIIAMEEMEEKEVGAPLLSTTTLKEDDVVYVYTKDADLFRVDIVGRFM